MKNAKQLFPLYDRTTKNRCSDLKWTQLFLIVSGAGSIELPIFCDATDDGYETTLSIVPSYDKKKQIFWP